MRRDDASFRGQRQAWGREWTSPVLLCLRGFHEGRARHLRHGSHHHAAGNLHAFPDPCRLAPCAVAARPAAARPARSEEHTSELQSLMRISYAVFCLKKKKKPANLLI